MEIAPDLVRRLKRLRLGGLLPTLPDRATHARQAKLAPLEFLELLLQGLDALADHAAISGS